MIVLARKLYKFKDDTCEVSSVDEIHAILQDLEVNSKFCLIIYKLGIEPDFQGLVLEKKSSNFTIKYIDNDKYNFDSFSINSLPEYNFHLNRFLNDDNQTKIFFENFTLKNKEKEKLKFNKWKAEYDEKRVIKKKKNNRLILLGIFLVPFTLYIGKLFYTGEYKFIGQEALLTEGNIYKVDWVHIGKGYYYQKLYFEYEVNGIRYSDKVHKGKSIGKMKEGNKIQIKVSKNNPDRYIILEF